MPALYVCMSRVEQCNQLKSELVISGKNASLCRSSCVIRIDLILIPNSFATMPPACGCVEIVITQGDVTHFHRNIITLCSGRCDFPISATTGVVIDTCMNNSLTSCATRLGPDPLVIVSPTLRFRKGKCWVLDCRQA